MYCMWWYHRLVFARRQDFPRRWQLETGLWRTLDESQWNREQVLYERWKSLGYFISTWYVRWSPHSIYSSYYWANCKVVYNPATNTHRLTGIGHTPLWIGDQFIKEDYYRVPRDESLAVLGSPWWQDGPKPWPWPWPDCGSLWISALVVLHCGAKEGLEKFGFYHPHALLELGPVYPGADDGWEASGHVYCADASEGKRVEAWIWRDMGRNWRVDWYVVMYWISIPISIYLISPEPFKIVAFKDLVEKSQKEGKADICHGQMPHPPGYHTCLVK